MVSVDQGADQRVVDGVPHLNGQQQAGHNDGVDAHELRPEDGQAALQGETGVAAEVAGGVGQFVDQAKLAVALGVHGFCITRHEIFLLFLRPALYEESMNT